MKTLKLFVAVIALVFAISLSACTVEYRQRHQHYQHRDNDGHREHNERH